MSSTQIFEAVKNYNEKVSNLGDASVDMKNNLLSIITEALNNEQFTRRFADKKNEEYSEFDHAVMSLIHKQLLLIDDSKVVEFYGDAIDSYKKLLELMVKERK
ncbi:hypothetical protein [Photobacterium leiognathi]|uniref:hypothetical protein n=1 Tax=Photobacterium leiognathi TaxID=553611 RepID=UPI0029825FCA|nr:hypothetical protein [Photobacterium leiognathi]